MKNTIIPIMILMVGAFLVFNSCQYDWIEFEEPVLPDTVSFANDVVPIFERGCNASGCHGGGFNPDLRPDVAYVSLMSGGYVDKNSPASSSIYTVMIPGGSMVNYTQPGEADLVLEWIEQGALDN